jgi:hypothetical protein
MFRQQAAARKAQLPEGSSPELMTIANIRDSYPVQLGLEIKGAIPIRKMWLCGLLFRAIFRCS